MYKCFDPNQIKPKGWLLEQLQIQANGLSGNLDKVWPDIRDSAWIGKDNDGWERVPYWLDGFIPLGRLLGDTDLIARADRYIYAIIDLQQPDGWICPGEKADRAKYDPWAVFLIGKVLALHYEFSKDQKVLDALYRAMKCFHKLLLNGEIHLFEWGKFRWFEAFISLALLWEQYHEDWIIVLGKEIRKQGAHYPDFIETWKRPMNQATMHTHIVNLCMMLKYEAVSCKLFGEPCTGEAERLWQILEQYNGTAVGTFTGDECLSGTANNQGTELCSVVELMYCAELLYRETGDSIWAERLEKITFNALPATFTDDMWAHQYDQMVNQIACITFPGRSQFRTNCSESHLFGLEPHFGCCTANFNQGWPKFAMNLFLRSENGIHCPTLLSGELNTVIDGVPVKITAESEYPFKHECVYTVEASAPVEFEFSVRIPAWAKKCEIDGSVFEGEVYRVSKIWNGTVQITVRLSAVPQLVSRPRNLFAAQYGPLVFSLPIKAEYKMLEYERNGVERKFPYCDYELYPQSEWRYGFANDVLIPATQEGDEYPFSSAKPRLVLLAKMCPVEWEYAEGYDSVSERVPVSDKPTDKADLLVLYPYGCSKLRMTEMPLCSPKP